MNPSAFISYSHDSTDHAARVLALANRLRSEGINVSLDQYETTPEQGWPTWMAHRIQKSDYVICVCSVQYYQKIMNEKANEIGQGVRWEGKLIYQHLYDQNSSSSKFIPIYFSDSSAAQIPTPLKGTTYYSIEGDGQYDLLYMALCGVSKQQKPPLGKLKPLSSKSVQTNIGAFFTSFTDHSLWDRAKWSGMCFLFDPRGDKPPSIGFSFDDQDAASQIFSGWHNRLGETDEFNELRISIIEGDIPGEKNGYSVVVTCNIQNIFNRADVQGIDLPKPFVIYTARVHRMNPDRNSQTLKTFKEHFHRFGSFFLFPCFEINGKLTPKNEFRLHKRDINFRIVSDITSPNDPDSLVFPSNRMEYPEP